MCASYWHFMGEIHSSCRCCLLYTGACLEADRQSVTKRIKKHRRGHGWIGVTIRASRIKQCIFYMFLVPLVYRKSFCEDHSKQSLKRVPGLSARGPERTGLALGPCGSAVTSLTSSTSVICRPHCCFLHSASLPIDSWNSPSGGRQKVPLLWLRAASEPPRLRFWILICSSKPEMELQGRTQQGSSVFKLFLWPWHLVSFISQQLKDVGSGTRSGKSGELWNSLRAFQ